MKRTTAWMALLLGSPILAACGGKVVVDASGGGSGGGGGTLSTSSSTSGDGGCFQPDLDVAAALDAARACNPAINAIQCDGTAVIHDQCGCSIVANEHSPDAVAAAQQAYNAWTASGCGPYDCTLCPPPPPAPYFCDATTSQCTAAQGK
jgi:hypothetical protein